ncbi:MAG: L,D-transpeptidase family protein, partial [Methyloceanibacter sp.]
PEAQGLAELKLNLAILKYARYARGGRFTPSKISSLFDQRPPLRDPKIVLAEIEAADAPDAYLQSLNPKHEQFGRLRQALLKARGADEKDEGGAKPAPNDKDIKRIIINMERWRWMPENLGSIYVWNNSAAFMLYVVKDDKTIFADKTLVGTIGYATPVFTTPMTTIVFNPDWNAPETVVKENILPPLQRKSYSILRSHKLFVSYQGKPVDPTKVDWNRVNVLNYTFSQRAGPHNNLGKVKFLYPNQHTVYMHDTLPVRKKYFKQSARTIGHECVRMEQPLRFAEILLAEANGWAAARVKELWDKGVNSSVALEKRVPVHMVYFTAVAAESGKVDTSADVYGLDRKMATALFDSAAGFPEPPPESKQPPAGEADASSPAARRNTADNDFARSMQGFLG